MRLWSLVPLTACCVVSVACAAQSALTPQSIQAQLQGQLLMLRGRYDGYKLKFNAEGQLEGHADLLPFGLSAVRVDGVRVTNAEVRIDATREGLEFAEIPGKPEAAHAVPWDPWDGVKIVIAWNPAQPDELRTAVGNIFAAELDAGLAKDAPTCWQPWLLRRHGNQEDPEPEPAASRLETLRPGVTNPKLLHAADPQFSGAARRLGYSGIVVLGLIVDASGMPQDIHIVKPLGMGLDEEAVKAVEQYRFAPARLKGKPVPVRINVEVNFRIGD